MSAAAPHHQGAAGILWYRIGTSPIPVFFGLKLQFAGPDQIETQRGEKRVSENV